MGKRVFDVRYHLIAAKACETTLAYYHEFLRDFAKEVHPQHEFVTDVVDKGYAYFLRTRSAHGRWGERERFKIVYSEQLVADMEGPYAERRSRFFIPELAFYEIDIMGYANGVATPKSMIVHTMCHEIAHLVCYLKYGSCEGPESTEHDDVFYRELSRVYNDGGYVYLWQDFTSRLELAGIKIREFCLLPDWDYVFSLPDDFECGDKVIVFDCRIRREPSIGVLLKKRKKTVKVALGKSPVWPELPDNIKGMDLLNWAEKNADRFLSHHYLRLEKAEHFYRTVM